MKESGRIEVAAGILRDAAGRILLAERPRDARFAGRWEFPGGKIEPGESAGDALVRELDEELGIAVRGFRHFLRVRHDYAHALVAIEFFLVEGWQGRPRGLDGQRLAWRCVDAVTGEDLLPANAPVLAALQSGGPGRGWL